MSEGDFSRTMSRLPDEGLIRIAFAQDEEGYLPDAVQAARDELGRRGVSEEQVRQVGEQTRDDLESAANRHLVPLSMTARILFGIFGMSLIAIVVAVFLSFSAYSRKASDAWRAIAWGFFGWMCVGALLIVLSLLGF